MRSILGTVGFTLLCSLIFLLAPLAWAAGNPVLKVDCDKGETIQSAITNAKHGDLIEVSGTCNESLLFDTELHDLTLDGKGMATIIGPDPTRDTIKIRGKEIAIRGFTITGGRNGISVLDDATAVMEGNRIEKTGRRAILVARYSSARILNNTIQNNPRGGILVHIHSGAQIGFSGPPKERVFAPNTIIQNGGSAAILVSRFSDAFIAGNVIRNNRKGIVIAKHSRARIGLPDGPETLGANKIEGNDSGIIIERSSSARIAGNSISDSRNSSGIQVRDDSHTLIARNTINNNAGHGIMVSGNSSVTLGNDTGSYTFDEPNETTVNNGRFGVRCEGGGYVKGRLGTLNGNGGKKSIAEGCIDKLVDGQKTEIEGLMASSVMPSPQSKIQNRQSKIIEGGALHKVNCQEGESVQNKLDEAKFGDVIMVRGSCHENLVIGQGLHDVVLDGQGAATINGPDPARDAIHVRGKGITIRGLTISGGRNGINIDQGARALIDSTIIERTAEDAIVVRNNSSANIIGNTIQNNPGTGIRIIDGSGARIGVSGSGGEEKFFPNTITHNGGRGISVKGTSEALIAGNTITNNRFRAIHVSDNSRVHIGLPDGKVDLGANTIESNGAGGIILRQSSFATIIGNRIRDNAGMHGIDVRESSHAEIARNSIDNNAGHGIRVVENSNVTLGRDKTTDFFDGSNTTAVNNGRYGIYCTSGGVVKGRIGTLNGKQGKMILRSDCIDESVR